MTAELHAPRPAGADENDRFLEAALAAARRGWAVFPLKPRAKVPAITRWEQRATTDPARIRAWWADDPACNAGIACGPSGLLVLDLDAAHGPVPPRWAALGIAHGRDVIALLAQRAQRPDPVATFTVATPRAGEHRFFWRPPGSRLRSTTGARGRGLGWHADTRGPGALVAAPGSVQLLHGHAVPYTVVRNDPVALLPDWLTTALTPPEPPPPNGDVPVHPPTSHRVTVYVNAAIRGEIRNVAGAEEGERHIAVFAAAAALGELAANGWITDAAITHYLTGAARRHLGVAEFTWTELTHTIRDGIKAGRAHRRHIPDR